MADKVKSTQSQTVIDYKTKHVYFYLPKLPENEGEVPDNIDLGAVLRLGGYSDMEQRAHQVPDEQLHYYPQKHIEDEGGSSSKNIFKRASGADGETSHGILMACDGRFLVKAGEKMYMETGDHHLQVNGDYEHNATGTIKVHSGGTYDVSSAEGQSITLNAGDQTGDMLFQANNKSESLSGNSSSSVLGSEDSKTSGNSTKIIGGMSWAHTQKVAVSAFAAGQVTLSSWGFQSFGYLIKLYPVGDMIIAGTRIQAVGAAFTRHQASFGYAALSAESRQLKLRDDLTSLDGIGIKIQNTDIGASDNAIHFAAQQVEMNSGEVEANTKGVIVFV
ncbi:hypothetical protein E1180_09520 [Roseibium denhamense]|uniref:Gp5/Type VI secretion system Vgr protein OB-fold domain-containing protein n=1 Tax=Roseibium denhamense TaxID=76305 RepID=A0ABY1PN94_9HYPH|nr:hypothetical protein [Roseibium denhamense]MTI05754.1 hypothetical protein [Roseibium denhamense]SMP36986.1 hypothetical protein SAMN06265374_4423 [Roseibium denhamense]